MAYAQIHIQAVRHPKVLRLSPLARWLWIAGLCYCQEHLTDGAIEPGALRHLLPDHRNVRRLVARLVAVGLWDVTPAGWQVHDYTDWNKTAAEIEAARARDRERKRRDRGAPLHQTYAELCRIGAKLVQPNSQKPRNLAQNAENVGSRPIGFRGTRRSTDQDHEDQSAGADNGRAGERGNGRPGRRVIVRRRPGSSVPPDVRKLYLVARDLLSDGIEAAELKEAVKARAAALGLAYDADAIRKALDQVQR